MKNNKVYIQQVKTGHKTGDGRVNQNHYTACHKAERKRKKRGGIDFSENQKRKKKYQIFKVAVCVDSLYVTVTCRLALHMKQKTKTILI